MKQTLKIGVVIPEVNTTMEAELPAWIPWDITLSTVRVRRPNGMLRTEDLPDERERVAEAGAQLAGFAPDLVVMGCTAAGFLAGPDGDPQFCSRLSQASGAPVVSAAGSMVAVLRAQSVRKVAVVTPYGPLVNAGLRNFLSSSGFDIASFEGFDVKGVEELLALKANDVAKIARHAMTDDSDALFVACSQLPTYDVLAALQSEMHRPAWSSVKAIAWNACRTLGIPFGEWQ